MKKDSNFPPFQHVKVAGSGKERGILIGENTRAKVESSLDTYQRLFALCDIPWTEAVSKAQVYLEHILKLSPVYLDELQGVAEGAGIDVDSLLALNCRTEILPSDFLSRISALESGKSTPHEPLVGQGEMINECTSFAVAGSDQNYWLAQNWDWCGLQRQSMCVVENHCDKVAHLTVTEAGMLAKIGINAYGMAITLNILRSNKDGVAEGIPVHFLLRALLDCEDVSHAVDLISGIRFSSSSNVMVLDADGHIVSFELSPHGVTRLMPEADQLCHTNHFLDKTLSEQDIGRPGNTSTISRLQRAQNAIHRQMSQADIIDVLSDQSDGPDAICRFADPELPDIAQIETVTAVIMNTAEKTLSVSSAQPSVSNFITYSI